MTIRTTRLELIPASLEALRADLAGPGELARALHRTVPESWPPELLDENAIRWVIGKLEEDSSNDGWYFHYFVQSDTRTVIGCGGYKGPPENGVVELGYSVLPEFQRQGFATEATLGMIEHAFAREDVERVIAHTLPGLTPSIGVLEKCGFTFTGPGEEEGTIRYELARKSERRGS